MVFVIVKFRYFDFNLHCAYKISCGEKKIVRLNYVTVTIFQLLNASFVEIRKLSLSASKKNMFTGLSYPNALLNCNIS